MTYSFRPAKRESVNLIIGLAGSSGSGKTFSALQLATGLSGGKPFALIDTEARRALHYADQFQFDHLDLQAPFSPDTYQGAIEAAEQAGYPVIVVDSFSHEHAGDGGLLDMHDKELDRMAGDDWKRRESCKMAAWIKPKQAHKKMVTRLLSMRCHLILCLRAEQKVDIKRVGGKTEIVPKTVASGFTDWIPVAEKTLLYELTCSMILSPEKPGVPIPVKIQEQHRAHFPTGQVITRESGAGLATWAAGDAASPTPTQSTQEPETPLSAVLGLAGSKGLDQNDLCEYLKLPDSATLEDCQIETLRKLYRDIEKGLVTCSKP